MAMNGANGGQKGGPTKGYGDREQELRRKEQELKQREQELRLRELEAEIMQSSEPAPPNRANDTNADYSETRKHHELPNRWQRMKRKTKLALQFAALVIAALVIVRVAGIIMQVVLIAAIAGIAYFILFGGEKK